MNRAPIILIVEDDRDIRDVLAEILAEEGYQVLVAEDGADGLRRLAEGPLPDLILLDLMMPRMDGYQFREEQRKNPAWSGIPLVLLTAGVETSDKITALGALDIVRKPVKIDFLLDLIGAAVRRAA
ncbi:response regulator transcription factor [Nannocystis bainbridge]|uniref:Response regulator n=1 Tax=Nannocystis bainbridge TaxID=2995303 RepID=A0ABT5EDB2_9BACT|nr:response regulator [Nannocystis bainbridge]MDC0723433.1 response regulator [Nannocystis bainbridge]